MGQPWFGIAEEQEEQSGQARLAREQRLSL
jgi:hypothetical protein